MKIRIIPRVDESKEKRTADRASKAMTKMLFGKKPKGARAQKKLAKTAKGDMPKPPVDTSDEREPQHESVMERIAEGLLNRLKERGDRYTHSGGMPKTDPHGPTGDISRNLAKAIGSISGQTPKGVMRAKRKEAAAQKEKRKRIPAENAAYKAENARKEAEEKEEIKLLNRGRKTDPNLEPYVKGGPISNYGSGGGGRRRGRKRRPEPDTGSPRSVQY